MSDSSPEWVPGPAGAASSPGVTLVQGWSHWAIYTILWWGLMFVVVAPVYVVMALFMAMNGVSIEATTELPEDHPATLPWMIAGHWLMLGMTLAVTWCFLHYGRGARLTWVGLGRPRRPVLEWLAGFGLELGHFGLIFAIGLLFGSYIISSVNVSAAPLIVLVALLAFIPAAAVEEITMRGYVLRSIEERQGRIPALIISSLVFALLHSMNPGARLSPWPMIGLFAAGLFLGVTYLATRSLWYPIAAHTAWNLMEGPVLGLPVSGMELTHTVFDTRVQGSTFLTGGSFGPEAGIPAILTTLLFCPIAWWLGQKVRGPHPDAVPQAESAEAAGPISPEPPPADTDAMQRPESDLL